MVRRARDLLTAPLPTPPGRLRVGPLREGAWSRDDTDTERRASWLGLWLGITFTVCLLTGLWSHAVQHDWLPVPSRPRDLYRVTQGLHVVTGLAAVPLLLAKLFAVYHRLFTWPPAKDLGHAVERASLLLLVGGSLFQLGTGVMNVAGWYAFGFFFTTVHYWASWVTTGALLVHVGCKLPYAQRGLRRTPTATPDANAPSRRAFLTATGVASGAVVLTAVGGTVSPLAPVSVLAARDPRRGPQGLPVNRTAAAAGTSRIDPSYRLVVVGATTLELSVDDLRSMRQTTARLPISCVEGWSADAVWTGVAVRDLLALAGSGTDRQVRVDSLQRTGRYRSSVLQPPHVRDPITLLALRVDGETLHPDHGYPVRLIAPNRPGVMQTKWVGRVVVL